MATSTTHQELNAANKVLVLGTSVSGAMESPEVRAVLTYAPNAQIDIVTPEQWKALTVQQFMTYRALIIGDSACQAGTEAFQAAIDNRRNWGPVVDGDVAILGTDPSANGIEPLIQNSIHYVLNSVQKRTGMYIALGCAYMNAPADTAVTLLEPFGTFKVQGVPGGCADSAHMFPMYNDLISRDLWDGMLPGVGGCAARSVFTSYPERSFSYAGIASKSNGTVPAQRVYTDYAADPGRGTPITGAPYILVRGAMTLGAGCGTSEKAVGEECDLGDGLNGQPAMSGQKASETCSWSCKNNWCGDGVVDAAFGEECDQGEANGRTGDSSGAMGACSASCKIPRPLLAGTPPKALCKDVTVMASNTCGATASIDNGSYDPDEDLVGCTQSPAGPFGKGNTTATLTCTDRAGNSASCTGVVTVKDALPPTISLNGDSFQSVECTKNGTYADPGATANDQCDGQLAQSRITRTGTVSVGTIGFYSVSYVATDLSGNVSENIFRTVSVADTLGPVITRIGTDTTLECATAYTDPGATANDQCEGDATARIVKTGSVNTNAVGDYVLRYNVKDSGNRPGAEVTRTLFVRDRTKPTVTLNLPTSLTLECGSGFEDPGASASDTCAGSLATSILNSNLNITVPGSYSITYKATDPSGNLGTSSARSVTVADTKAPTLTLLGAANIALECASAFTDPGATASDLCYGNLTSSIVKTGTVNNKQLGAQTLTYNVKDPKNNAAAPVSRTVTVSDTQGPAITVTGPLTQSVECGGTYTDPGASASDACTGAVPVTANGAVNASAPGTYNVTYSATDASGNKSTSTSKRTVTVSDTLPPTLTLNGSANLALECGSSFTDPGASANDQCTGTLPVSVYGAVNPKVPGSYALSYSATDGSEHSVSASRTVTVRDTLGPALTLNGPAAQSLECGAEYNEQGATANDACAGVVPVTVSGSVNSHSPGNYAISYSANDGAGHSASATRTVSVNDTLAPTLTLNGAATQSLECGAEYNDQGATATDACAGALPVTVTGAVNTHVPASYALTYSANDGAGHNVSAGRTVAVTDTLAPVITVNGPLNVTYECGGSYVDPGATANDACAGALPVTSTQSGNPSQPGQIIYTYTATDPSGNTVTSPVTRTVSVNDNAPPVLALNGPAIQSLECGSPYTDPGAVANDACFGDMTSRITRSGSVNSSATGAYTLVYNVTDPAGQSAPSVSRVVNVSDTLAPSITVLGAANQQVQCGSPYVDPGATATDVCSGNLPVVTNGSVNTHAVGSYTLGYSASDAAGNTATAASARAVSVIDTLAPSISLNGAATQTLECGSTYEDPGATASDVCSGDLSSAIVKTGSVNTAVLGNYTLGYSVADGVGLTASTSRSVKVRDTLAPQLQLLEGASTIQCNAGPYVDPGATASDSCAGNLTSRITRSSNLDPTRAGQYTINYSVTDDAGNTTTATRLLTVVGPCSNSCIEVHLNDYNLFLEGDYNDGHDVVGKVAAGGNITMTDFAVGSGLSANDTANTLVAGGNMTLNRGAVWGDAFYGGSFSANASVTFPRGTLPAQGTPIDFAARFAELRSVSARLGALPANGTTTRESWGGVMLKGTNSNVNVFDVNASAFTGAVLLSIEAPSGSFVVVNIRGSAATLQGFGHSFSGVDQHNILYNFVDATSINASGYGFWGTVLAPYAHMTVNNGSWDGGIYAKSLTGNAEGHINPLNDRTICP
ncbi:immunoglobulin-like domain-containing protein [Hyalangium versicolor]|uniref:immunoglobulin-like domain-containing protein n=1 Tax=Hyalangium versicolor TaxID=2861190 RepID=UPI001CCFA84C|nr:immunoglobulin-like domain-containing protein [Hyalangium versicolor]